MRRFKFMSILIPVVLLTAVFSGCVYSNRQPAQPSYPPYQNGYGPGMMGPGETGPGESGPEGTGPGQVAPGQIGPGQGMMGGPYPYGYGPGGIMGPGGMMGGGYIGPGGPYRQGGQRISMDEATTIAQNYLNSAQNNDLAIAEIMEFEYNFYVEYYEKSTGIYAFETLIDPYTGDMYPEPGPNMMWNTRYGMMSGFMWSTPYPSSPMTVSADEATQDGQKFIDSYLPGGKVEEPHQFYGYYTFHVFQNGQIYGMLSVNGYTGQVWYHSWHGRFLGMKEFREGASLMTVTG
jgi:hypothetical protein